MRLPAIHQLDLNVRMLCGELRSQSLGVGMAGAFAAIHGQELKAGLESTDRVQNGNCAIGVG